ncbi:hypothetical protein P2G74_01540 [Cronobacter muytjensii]|uniref:hypothetical protein n=1 Tax=Cronobacter muytjensii TaxID=413501 RepID=UPI002DB7C654|nr:hypothetical protein [Cronobacter muytjensii]MEB8638655.1 hypothetical protein [Cronobacter muytjensii]
MNGVMWLSEYQDAVLAELKKIPWAATIGLYPEIPDDFSTPAIFFDVARWERADQNVGGKVTINLTCNLFLLRHFVSSTGEDETEQGSTETRIRNAALIMSDWIHGRVFAAFTAPAELVSAEPMTWERGDSAPAHAIWCVSFNQLLAVGLDPFAPPPDAPLLKEVYLGFSPEIGPDHIDEYTRIVPK